MAKLSQETYDKIVELYRNGVAGQGGFGDWLVKPKNLGQLKRRIK